MFLGTSNLLNTLKEVLITMSILVAKISFKMVAILGLFHKFVTWHARINF